jgi:hypothetical protein
MPRHFRSTGRCRFRIALAGHVFSIPSGASTDRNPLDRRLRSVRDVVRPKTVIATGAEIAFSAAELHVARPHPHDAGELLATTKATLLVATCDHAERARGMPGMSAISFRRRHGDAVMPAVIVDGAGARSQESMCPPMTRFHGALASR